VVVQSAKAPPTALLANANIRGFGPAAAIPYHVRETAQKQTASLMHAAVKEMETAVVMETDCFANSQDNSL